MKSVNRSKSKYRVTYYMEDTKRLIIEVEAKSEDVPSYNSSQKSKVIKTHETKVEFLKAVYCNAMTKEEQRSNHDWSELGDTKFYTGLINSVIDAFEGEILNNQVSTSAMVIKERSNGNVTGIIVNY